MKKVYTSFLSLGFLCAAAFILSSCDFSTFVRFPDVVEPEVITKILPLQTVEQPEIRRVIDGALITDVRDQNIIPAGVVVENSADAWPLSGVDKAQIVYEALAESYIPRLLALFASREEIEQIGPVRSVRPYFVDWASGYGSLFMHVGGSPEGLARVNDGDVINVDEFRYGGVYFWRSKNRNAPHNVYTSSELIAQYLDDRGTERTPSFRMWQYTDETPAEQRPQQVNDIVINFTTDTYKTRWKYDRDTNEYVRYERERPFLTSDGNTIRAKNIIVTLNATSVIDSLGRKKIQTSGEGDAWIFRNGEAIEGKWTKDSPKEREVYYDTDGNEISLVGGTTWIEIIPNKNMLEY